MQESALSKLLNENAIEPMINSTWQTFWSRFIIFGSVSAGFLAIIMIFQCVKSIINVFIHRYTAHRLRLVRQITWSIFLNHLLIHLNNRPPAEPPIELNQVNVSQPTSQLIEKFSEPSAPTVPNAHYPNLHSNDHNVTVQKSST